MRRRPRSVLLNVKHKLSHSAHKISRVSNFSVRIFLLSLSLSHRDYRCPKRKFFSHFTNTRYPAWPAIIPRAIIRQRCKFPPSPVFLPMHLFRDSAFDFPRNFRTTGGQMAHESQPLSLNNASVPHLPRAARGESLVAVCALCIYYLSVIYTPHGHTPRIISHNIRAWRAYDRVYGVSRS